MEYNGGGGRISRGALGVFLHTKADALLCVRYTEWDHDRDAARCPEGGGWGDGDHDPGESVRGSGGVL